MLHTNINKKISRYYPVIDSIVEYDVKKRIIDVIRRIDETIYSLNGFQIPDNIIQSVNRFHDFLTKQSAFRSDKAPSSYYILRFGESVLHRLQIYSDTRMIVDHNDVDPDHYSLTESLDKMVREIAHFETSGRAMGTDKGQMIITCLDMVISGIKSTRPSRPTSYYTDVKADVEWLTKYVAGLNQLTGRELPVDGEDTIYDLLRAMSAKISRYRHRNALN